MIEQKTLQTQALIGDEKAKAQLEIQQIASELGMTYVRLMKAAHRWVATGEEEYMGEDEVDLPDDFWPLYETVTSTKVKPDQQESFFRCAC